MNENTKVKDCPHRLRDNIALRGTNESDCWMSSCAIQGAVDQLYNCHMHGNCKLSKCKFYKERSLKELRDAFKKLEGMEKYTEAVRAIMRM